MDVLGIVRALKRHWRWTVPIAVLVIVVAGYVYVSTPTSYEATASYVLFPPPAAPTPDEIKENPLLGFVKAENPYTRMDQAVVAELVAKRVTNETNRKHLVAEGADPGYDVVTGGLYGISSPTADMQGTGATPEEAIATARLVGKDFTENLHGLQQAQGTDDAYMVRAVEVDPPTSASQKVSSRLRSMLAVLALGAVVLFVVVSIGEAFENVRRERVARRSQFVLPDSAESGLVTTATMPTSPSTTNGAGSATARWR